MDSQHLDTVEELRAELARCERMRRALTDVIVAVGSGVALPDLFVRVCGIIDDAWDATGAVVYLWDSEIGRLVLRAMTGRHPRDEVSPTWIPDFSAVGQVQLRLGEGLVGWVAAHREPVLLARRQWEDPRVTLIDQIPEEEIYESSLVVPLLVHNSPEPGVVMMVARHPDHFTEEHLRLLTEIAAVLAGVIEKTELDAELARRARVLDFLGEMSRRLASAEPRREVMDWVAARTAEVTDSAACMLTAGTAGRFGVAGLAGVDVAGVSDEELFRTLSDSLPDRFSHAASAPLLAGAEQLGFVTCYRNRRYSGADQELLGVIAGQVALGYRAAGLLDREQDPIAELLADLARGRQEGATVAQAASLGVDLTRPHVLVQARLLPVDNSGAEPIADRRARAAKQLMRTVEAAHPGSLVRETTGGVVGLVRVAKPADSVVVQVGLTGLGGELTQRHGMALSAGISSACLTAGEYTDAHREAAEALEVGAKLRGEGHVVRFEELGPDLHLFRMAADPRTRRDPWVRALGALVDDPTGRGSELLATLDAYLENRSNVVLTAERLGMHRNTLRQRLDRVQVLTGIDLDATQDWLPLRLAVKLVRMTGGLS